MRVCKPALLDYTTTLELRGLANVVLLVEPNLSECRRMFNPTPDLVDLGELATAVPCFSLWLC